MADYYPLISRAVAGLERNTGENRRSLYERARNALLDQLRNVTPALSETDITRERLGARGSDPQGRSRRGAPHARGDPASGGAIVPAPARYAASGPGCAGACRGWGRAASTAPAITGKPAGFQPHRWPPRGHGRRSAPLSAAAAAPEPKPPEPKPAELRTPEFKSARVQSARVQSTRVQSARAQSARVQGAGAGGRPRSRAPAEVARPVAPEPMHAPPAADLQPPEPPPAPAPAIVPAPIAPPRLTDRRPGLTGRRRGLTGRRPSRVLRAAASGACASGAPTRTAAAAGRSRRGAGGAVRQRFAVSELDRDPTDRTADDGRGSSGAREGAAPRCRREGREGAVQPAAQQLGRHVLDRGRAHRPRWRRIVLEARGHPGRVCRHHDPCARSQHAGATRQHAGTLENPRPGRSGRAAVRSAPRARKPLLRSTSTSTKRIRPKPRAGSTPARWSGAWRTSRPGRVSPWTRPSAATS